MLENHFQTWHPLQRYAVVVPKSIWQADRDAGSGAGRKSVFWALKTHISSKYIVRHAKTNFHSDRTAFSYRPSTPTGPYPFKNHFLRPR